MSNDLFAEVQSEGATLDIDKAFERLETKGEKPVESQPTKEEAAAPSQGGEPEKDNTPEAQTPFHKHPRWIKTQEELKALREETIRLKEASSEGKGAELPTWWKNQYGDTDESKQRYQAVVQKDGELEWLKQQILGEIEAKTQAEQAQTKAGEEYVDTQLAEMSDEGLKFERNKLLKFMVDFQGEFGAGALLDTEGNYDFRKGLALMERTQPAQAPVSDVRKQVASLGARGKASSERPNGVPILSRHALRGGNWRDAETGQFVKS